MRLKLCQFYSRLPEDVINHALSFYNPYKIYFTNNIIKFWTTRNYYKTTIMGELIKVTDHLKCIYDSWAGVRNWFNSNTNEAAVVKGKMLGAYIIPKNIYSHHRTSQAYWKQKFIQGNARKTGESFYYDESLTWRYNVMRKGSPF
jgi:hypothetical protein